MEIQSTTGAAMVATSSQAPEAGNALGRDDFMRLLMTQMQAQDPLEPMDNTQFTAQLAQFSSLENLEAMTGSMNNMAVSQAANTSALMVSFIGKTVDVTRPEIVVEGGSAGPVGFTLPQEAASVEITIVDESGKVVRRIDAGQLGEGANEVNWDGLDDDGNPVADGTYTARVEAEDDAGEKIEASMRMGRTVTGVTFNGGVPMLMLEGDSVVSLGEVVEVTEGGD